MWRLLIWSNGFSEIKVTITPEVGIDSVIEVGSVVESSLVERSAYLPGWQLRLRYIKA